MALRNAAKVVFGSLVMGCGGTLASLDKPDAAEPRADADAVRDGALVPDASLACLGPVGDDAGSVTESQFRCCVALVDEDIGDAGWAVDDAGLVVSPGQAAVEGDPSGHNCCNAIVARIDQGDSGRDDYFAAGQTVTTCCNVFGEPSGPACTPWGPPMPAEMVS